MIIDEKKATDLKKHNSDGRVLSGDAASLLRDIKQAVQSGFKALDKKLKIDKDDWSFEIEGEE